MTYTIPFIHKYRFIIAILLTAFVSASLVAFKPVPATAEATVDTQPSTSSFYASPAVFRTMLKTPPLADGTIVATGKLTFERPLITTTPAPKKEEPVVKKTEDPKPDVAPTTPTAADSGTAPAATPVPAKAQAQAQAAAQAPAAAPDTAPANPAPVASTPMAGTSPAAAQAFARSYLASKGMGDSEFQCLVTLWNHESGWNFQASNSGSGAYGIPQSLPGSKMASAGADWQTNPQTQIIWGVGYITGRYATPCGAVAIWNTRGWY